MFTHAKKFFLIIISIFLFTNIYAYSDEGKLDGIIPNKDIKYIIEFYNGDIFSGYVVEMISHPEDGDGIKFSTVLGTTTIFEDEISVIKPEKEFYRHTHRIFLLPTAEPIEDNSFIGNFELLFFYVGLGISDWASITVGRSIIPSIRSDQQLSIINTKFSLLDIKLDPNKKLSVAVGGNLTFINHNNRLIHYYGVSTLTLNRSAVSASVYYKSGGKDYYKINFTNNSSSNYVDLVYPDGTFGIGLGIDTRFSNMHNLHFIGELWNNDVTQPSNTAVMLGLRLTSTNFSADFGLSFFTQPFVIPFFSFVWTPF